MYAYKPFLSDDVIVFPFEVNRKFNYSGSNITSSGVDIFLGKNIDNGLYSLSISSGFNSSYSQYLVYDSIKRLYYSNYLSSSYGDEVNRKILIPGYDNTGDVYVGSNKNSSYVDYFSTTLSYPKYFPTGSEDEILVISIPKTLYGENIKPNSFEFNINDEYIRDDGESNLINSSNNIVGNIFYNHGLAVLLNNQYRVNEVEINLAFLYDADNLTTSSWNPNVFFIEAPAGIPIHGFINITSSITSPLDILAPSEIVTPDNLYLWYSQSLVPAISSSMEPNWSVELQSSSSRLSPYVGLGSGAGYIFSSSILFRYSNLTLLTTESILTESGYILIDSYGGTLIDMYTTDFNSSNFSSSYNINNYTCSFSSSFNIYETQYRCQINENEFNFSLNPSLNSSSYLYSFATGSEFKPYITTIGLYNDYKELMAVAKLSQPVMLSDIVNTNIIINIDL